MPALRCMGDIMSNFGDSNAIPRDPLQRNEWIKFQLRIRGKSMSELARQLGVTRQAVRNALTTSYPKMERVIAQELDLEPEVIWPERYQRRGQQSLESVRD